MRFVACCLLSLFNLLALASAHGFLVSGRVVTFPEPILAQQPFELRLELSDPLGTPVEDALVFVELQTLDSESLDPLQTTVFLHETAPGLYHTQLNAESQGTYLLVIRDQTYPQEEARAEIPFNIGLENPELSFWLPPTATAPKNIFIWLLWLILVPLLAGLITTFLVIRKPVLLGEPLT